MIAAQQTLSIVDLSGPASACAEAIDSAAQADGFLAIANHGVDQSVIDRCWTVSAEFFAQPLEAKLAARHPSDANHPYGYFPMGREALARSVDAAAATFDLKETFNLGPGLDGEDPTGRFGRVERIWPPDINPALDTVSAPGLSTRFRSAWIDYVTAMEALSMHLMELFALALDRPHDLFARAHIGHLSALRAANYPALSEAPAPGQLRAGAHSDYGTLTVLAPGPGDGGLEIATPGGGWRSVEPIDGCFVVNLGDLMEVWSGGRWPSTVHRVAVPSDVDTSVDRMALAYFCQPAGSALIEPLDGADPFRFGDWLAAKFDRASNDPTTKSGLN